MNPNPYIVLTLAFAGLIHAGFSLGTSMLVLLSGHSLSRKRSHARLISLAGGFVMGALLMILLLLSTLTYFGLLVNAWAYPIIILALSSLTALSGLWVLFFYYRRGDGTALWLPRGFARYLTERTAHTKNPFESFVLGAASILFELPVTIWLLATVAVMLGSQGPRFQAAGLAGYSILSVLALFLIFVLIGGGHTPASITRFRARHKRFLQVIVGLSLLLIGGALFVDHLDTVMAAHGVILW
jgi:hypothetical protein